MISGDRIVKFGKAVGHGMTEGRNGVCPSTIPLFQFQKLLRFLPWRLGLYYHGLYQCGDTR